MSFDLIVIGRGYWGVAAAHLARQAGARVLVVDSGEAEAASPNASGHVSFGWYSGAWRGRADRGAALADRAGVVLYHAGARIHYPAGRLKPKARADWYTFQPDEFLRLAPIDTTAAARRVAPGRVELAVGGTDQVVEASRIIIAAGAWTDPLLRASGLPPLHISGLPGTGVIFERHAALREVWLHAVTPYYQVALRDWGEGRVRLGETIEKRPGNREHYVSSMLRRAGYLVEGLHEVGRLSGVRPVRNMGPTVKTLAPGIVAMGGGGRIGAMLAFWAAEVAMKKLELA